MLAAFVMRATVVPLAICRNALQVKIPLTVTEMKLEEIALVEDFAITMKELVRAFQVFLELDASTRPPYSNKLHSLTCVLPCSLLVVFKSIVKLRGERVDPTNRWD